MKDQGQGGSAGFGFRRPREGGDPGSFGWLLDSRLRGNDGIKPPNTPKAPNSG